MVDTVQIHMEEHNPIGKKWRKDQKKVALAYPNFYKAGIANLGLQQIYAEVNGLDTHICERFYSDIFGGKKSVESGDSVSDFDWTFMSLQYEEDYPQAIKMVQPARNRVAGGPCVMENPVPLKNFFDSFFVGEVDGKIPEILNGQSVDGLLQKDGNGDLESGEQVKRRWVKLEDHLHHQIMGEGAYGKSLLLEIGRGCKRKCRFCLVRQLYRPCRWRDIDSLLEVAEEGRKLTDKVALIAPSVGDHPHIKELTSQLMDMGYMVSPSSLRADTVDEEMIELLSAGGLKSITVAPEAGSERMREIIKKEIGEDDILHTADLASSAGFKKMKLYFMVGLPHEDEEDIQAIIDLVGKVKSIVPKVSVSINPMVPKPHTPFQWMPFGGNPSLSPQENIKELNNKLKFLKKELKRIKVEAETGNVKKFAVQTITSRGDEKVGEALPRVRINDFQEYLGGIDVDKQLPWDFIDHGYRKTSLAKEFERI
ncbi:MAG: radical SAM protein [Archaeoglobaceae archaeon]